MFIFSTGEGALQAASGEQLPGTPASPGIGIEDGIQLRSRDRAVLLHDLSDGLPNG